MKSLSRIRPWRVLLTLWLVTTAASALAQDKPTASAYPNTPEGVVRAYCETLYRVSGRNSLEMPSLVQRYMAFDGNYPAMYVVLVTDYQLSRPAKLSNDRYRIDVTYTVVAFEYMHSEGGPFFTTFPITETVPFIVRKTLAVWKIDYPRGLLPHVSVAARLEYWQKQDRDDFVNIIDEHLKVIGMPRR